MVSLGLQIILMFWRALRFSPAFKAVLSCLQARCHGNNKHLLTALLLVTAFKNVRSISIILFRIVNWAKECGCFSNLLTNSSLISCFRSIYSHCVVKCMLITSLSPPIHTSTWMLYTPTSPISPQSSTASVKKKKGNSGIIWFIFTSTNKYRQEKQSMILFTKRKSHEKSKKYFYFLILFLWKSIFTRNSS